MEINAVVDHDECDLRARSDAEPPAQLGRDCHPTFVVEIDEVDFAVHITPPTAIGCCERCSFSTRQTVAFEMRWSLAISFKL